MKQALHEPGMPLIRSIAIWLLAIVGSTGCANFEHPLPWTHSPLHESLVGAWHSYEDSSRLMKMDVIKNESGSLFVEIYLHDSVDGVNSETSLPFSSTTGYVSFQGDVLESSDVHVLQIDMKSYDVRDSKDEERHQTNRNGYRFVRVLPTENLLEMQLLDIESFARLAEHVLANREPGLTIKQFSDCVDDGVSDFIVIEAISDLTENEAISWTAEDDFAELVQLEQNLRDPKPVNPYKELQAMKECVAYKLPGEVLGTLFERNPEDSFAGEKIRMTRTQ